MIQEGNFNFKKIKIKLATPRDILSWSHGEVTKPETINYRTLSPEKDGLFDERIFGPVKDYECHCGKYKKIRFKGLVCDRCGVEVTKSIVRRERMGHIQLASPVSHIWFIRYSPSIVGSILNKSSKELEKVIYFTHYIIFSVDEELKKHAISRLEQEFNLKFNKIQGSKKTTSKEIQEKIKELEELRQSEKERLVLLKPLKIISEADYINLSQKYGEVFEAGIGAEAIKKILEKIKEEDSLIETRQAIKEAKGQEKINHILRLRVVQSLIKNNIKYTDLILDVVPIIPPELRPMVQLDGGRFASSDLNDLYRRIINRNNRLKKLIEIRAPEIIIRNEKRMLQEAVDALIDNQARKGKEVRQAGGQRRILKSLGDLLRGKEGRFRQNLLGKRVDYSGRSVITVGPELRLNECGIPKKILLEVFKPFIISYLVYKKEIVPNIKMATRLIEDQASVVWDALDEIIKDKYVMLNRAPTLHRASIQAFKPVMVDSKTIQVHPLVCEAYNADFDGDQMAIYLPLSKKAQEEARDLMLTTKNLLKPANGNPMVNASKDIVLGIYLLTVLDENKKAQDKIFSSFKEALVAYDFDYIKMSDKIKIYIKGKEDLFTQKKNLKKGKTIETSIGRIFFNELLPESYDFINEKINKKYLQKIISNIILNNNFDFSVEYLERIKEFGFKYSTESGASWGMDDLITPKDKYKIIDKTQKEISEVEKLFRDGYLAKPEKKLKIIELWLNAIDQISKLVPQEFDKNDSVFAIFDSGARGSWGQAVQMSGIKGIVTDPKGELIEIPIISSFKEGLSEFEYFISTHGARKGVTDTALKTSVAGYLTRRLVDVAHDVIVREDDCKTLEGLYVTRADSQAVGIDFKDRLWGRFINEDIQINKKPIKKGTLIDSDLSQQIEDSNYDKIFVRSPIFCKTKYGICSKCFGLDLSRNRVVELGEAVGVVAAQSIGEPGTQLTMRTFHVGGVAGKDITQGLPRIEEIFETRKPKSDAFINKVDGIVKKIIKVGKEMIIAIEHFNEDIQKDEILEYTIPLNNKILIKEGDKVLKGDILTTGDLDLHLLYQYKGLKETVKYIINEVIKVYAGQGVGINEKYIEIIAKKMFSRIRIIDSGDSEFTINEIIEKDLFNASNERLIRNGKKNAKGQTLLLGITKVALTCESFLSAMSFQETTRVLTRAALKGKEDHLRGLKENVIIGRLLPIGENFRQIIIERKKAKLARVNAYKK